jgi:hypothetical protein
MEAQQGAQAVDTPVCYFARLPNALLLLLILALLPVDTRLRCAEVCRGWRAALVERRLWLRLDLSPESGVTRAVTNALLRAAAARAGGGLLSLAAMDCPAITRDALLAVATENAATLREARLCIGAHDRELSWEHLEALLRAAPLLRTLHADVECGAAEARRLLRNEPPFQVLRVRRLRVLRIFGDEAATLALAADVTAHATAHASLEQLYLLGALLHAPAALDAIVEAALACRLRRLELGACRLSPASAPALARLIVGGALTTLHIHAHAQLLDEPAAVLLGDALRVNTTLTSLNLYRARLWQVPAAGVALLNALTAHPSLCELVLQWDAVGEAQQQAGAAQQHAGAAFGALVAANAPTLRELNMCGSGLDDAGLGPLVDALPANTHLEVLDCAGHGASAAFVRERLLPAVRPGLVCRHR